LAFGPEQWRLVFLPRQFALASEGVQETSPIHFFAFGRKSVWCGIAATIERWGAENEHPLPAWWQGLKPPRQLSV
jgi:hypothetical protein